jgi:hypothetical protein
VGPMMAFVALTWLVMFAFFVVLIWVLGPKD